MSWFTNAESSGGEVTIDESPGLEVAEGVVVERRTVLWLSAGAIATALTGTTALGQDPERKADTPRPADGSLSFREFLGQVYPSAKEIVASSGKHEEAYLMTLSAALSRLRDPGAPIRREMRAFVAEHREDGKRFPLLAVLMRLQPGRGFRHHDHRDYNGVILGVEGECRIRNYDILGDDPVPPRGKTFQIRETRNDLIQAGRFSTLGRSRENVHDLVAGPDGAKLLDVFTYFEADARSYYLTVDDKPRDEDKRIYDAAWK